MREKVAVGMSGGVDSSVAAFLLKESGFDIVGLFMRNGRVEERQNQHSCCSMEDAYDARRVAEALKIPLYAVNFAEEFDGIIDYFVGEYNAGRTPNPCVMCNRYLKFGRLFDYARAVGATKVATGHYARIEPRGGRWALRRGADPAKDQSYMLATLTQEQLSATVLPLGGRTKEQVREVARSIGLRVCDKPDSQEICFVPDRDYRRVVREKTPEGVRPGEIRTADGRVVGAHEGHQLYTIGQRRGLGAFGRPVYVVGIDASENAVIVGGADETLRRKLSASRVNWISSAASAAGSEIRATVKIRHMHAAAPGKLRATDDDAFEVTFDAPQRAVTPGQLAVCYSGDDVLCSGWINSA